MWIVVALILFSGVIRAEGESISEDLLELRCQIDRIDLNEKRNVNHIKLNAISLTTEEKYYLFDSCALTKPDIYYAIALNTAPGFGMGSYLIGDKKGGKTQLIIQLISLAVAGGGTFYHLVLESRYSSVGSLIMIADGVGFLSGTIYGMIRPLKYFKIHNDALAESLGVSPMVTMYDKTVAPGICVSMRF